MKIALTGATGFIGQLLTKSLLDARHEVLALVRSAASPQLADFPQVRRLHWDATAETKEIRDLEGVDVLVHLAAFIPSDQNDPMHAERCLKVNALGTLNLANWATASNVRDFIYISSGNIYRFKTGTAKETDPIYPSSRAPYYLSSKLVGEIYVDHWGRTTPGRATIVRLSSVYGPGMGSRGLIPALARRAQNGQSLQLTDGGRYQMDLVYVDDVVSSIRMAAERAPGGLINVGSGHQVTALEVARLILRLTKSTSSLVDVAPAASERPQDPGFAALNIDRARKLLDLSPRSLQQGLSDYL